VSIDLRAVLTSRSLAALADGADRDPERLHWGGDLSVAQVVRAQEAWGFDSTVAAPPLASTDPAVVASWALTAARRIGVVAVHRIGIQQPTQAARAFATRSELSDGRAKILLLSDGANGRDVADGDGITGEARGRRALEYAEIFRRELDSEEPFDFAGEFYQVRGAFSGIKPVGGVAGTIAAGGRTEQEIELAARFADVYALPATTLERTGELIEAAQRAALRAGRRLEFWRAGNVVLAETDSAARQRAERLAALAGPAADADVPGEADLGLSSDDWADDVLFQAIGRTAGRAAALVGSPATVAARIAAHYEQGVTIATIGGIDGSSAEQRRLLDALLAEIRYRVAELDLGASAA
jgi:alkanesulfonate monooxygenase